MGRPAELGGDMMRTAAEEIERLRRAALSRARTGVIAYARTGDPDLLLATLDDIGALLEQQRAEIDFIRRTIDANIKRGKFPRTSEEP